MKKSYYYAVEDTAILSNWDACKAIIDGKPLQHKKFETLIEALSFKGEDNAEEYTFRIIPVPGENGSFRVLLGTEEVHAGKSKGGTVKSAMKAGAWVAVKVAKERCLIPCFYEDQAEYLDELGQEDPKFANFLDGTDYYFVPAPIVAAPVTAAPIAAGDEDDLRKKFEAALAAFNPTAEQAEMLRKLDSFLADDNPAMLLSGCAGTGKTTLAIYMAMMVWLKTGLNTLLVAPTNKAVHVLDVKAGKAGLNGIYDCGTIHSKLYRVDPETLRCSYQGLPGRYFVICDEVSMVSDSEDTAMIADLIRAAKFSGSKIVFMGDPFQLPPVGEGKTIWQYGLSHHALKKVMRQADGSDVLALATCMRYFGRPVHMQENGHHGDIHQCDSAMMVQNFISQYINGMDIVGLAFTNKRRVSLNRQIREGLLAKGFLKGELPPRCRKVRPGKLEAGEAVISIANSKAVNILNGESFKAENVEYVDSVDLIVRTRGAEGVVDGKLEADLLIVNGKKTVFFPDTGKASSIYHSSIKNAAVLPQGWTEENWEPKLASDVVIATYGYVITIHKSQGGQWERVYVFETTYAYDFVNKCVKDGCVEYAARGLYTAVTRAAKSVVMSTGMIWDWWRRLPSGEWDNSIWMKAGGRESLFNVMAKYNEEQDQK